MNELQARVISQEKGIYLIFSSPYVSAISFVVERV